MPSHRSSAVPLAWLYAALVVYASLYPFTGWRSPGGSPWSFLLLPWPHWWTGFDLLSNLIGYVPLGALLFGALVRSGWSVRHSVAAAMALGSGLSFAMESAQNFLPHRVASNIDLVLNVTGTGLGVLIGVATHTMGGVERWQAVRDRWFIDRSAGGLALLVLWPLGLLFPAPVPFGLGQLWPRLRDALESLLEGTPAWAWTQPWLQGEGDVSATLSPGSEFMAIVFGLLAPCLISFTISRPGWRRVVLAVGSFGVGVAAMTLSIALNFGPEHALAWQTPISTAALAAALVLALGLAWMPRRAAAGFGLLALGALVALVAQAPSDPYFAESLQAWEQGRFIRFHGAAQWVGWLWPYAAMGYLLARVGARAEPDSDGVRAGP